MGIMYFSIIYELDSAHVKCGVDNNCRTSVEYSTGTVECSTELAFNCRI